jgi:GAF domain-containing protein/anti-sigma regulatory factor (Ser/Thr protein kinase)
MLLAVYRAAERVTAELDLTRALEEIIACVRHPLGLDRAGVFLLRPRRGDLTRLIGVGHDGSLEYGSEEPIPMADRHGPMQQVARGELPYFHSHDVRRDVSPEVVMPAELRAHAIVPLINRGEIIGVMAVDNMLTGRDIPEAMIRPLCLFAHFAALALGNALRAHDLGELNRKLRRLVELAGSFGSILWPQRLLEEMLDGIPELMQADRYSAWRRRSDQDWECVASRGLSDAYLEAALELYRSSSGEKSVIDWLFHGGEPVYVPDVPAKAAEPGFASALQQEGYHSFFGIPFSHGSEILGCLNLYYDSPPDLTEQDWEIARLFARHAGTALRNAELFQARSDLQHELSRVNEELELDRQLLLDRQEALEAGEEQKKQFYRDVLYSMTNGKIVLCDAEEISRDWDDQCRTEIRSARDVKHCREIVHRIGRQVGMSDERLDDLCLCASEAATNAFKHAGGGWMSVSERDGQLRVRVSDQGGGIDALQLPHATLMRGFSTQRSMGLGFTLIHEMTDRLCLSTGSGGTSLIMEMAIHPESEIDQALALLRTVDL